MRLPNGYGTVYRLSGPRRRPWAVLVSKEEYGGNTVKKKRQVPVGYYETREEALQALAEYHKDPYGLEASSVTFEEVYERWSAEHYPKISEGNVKGYRASYKVCGDLYKMRFTDIRLTHLQHVVDTCGKNYPTLKKLKILLSQLFAYAKKNDIVSRDYSEYIDIVQYKDRNPDAIDRQPFAAEEVDRLWKAEGGNYTAKMVLCMIYCGARIGELYALRKEDLHLDEQWFWIRKAKTAAGVREVPIADRVVRLWQECSARDSDYVFCNAHGRPFSDRTFRDQYWQPLMDQLMLDHHPHDTRHTCVSLLTSAGVDDRIIKKIVGHAGQGVTENVYTHLEMPLKLEAINKINV